MTDRHALERLEPAVLIAIGGFAGANLRYAVEFVVPGRLGPTLAANALGSLLLGVVLYEAVYAGRLSPRTRTVLGTGFLSSFTTYSTFAVQSAQSAPSLLVANVLANYALGFAGVLVGRSLARRFVGTRDPPADAGAGTPRGQRRPEGGDR